ncbi:hypothetical protein CTAYLR_005294 [Chrysophaeum taylorii]|uniref:Uncharacterized protein n=1 Tax=Chrysophaeum taylorii TaxID=2483200 RepID=A0AAD7XNC8_9STRA|nr:hypothetical protein CTAYLR_005294 [Chrysophaeum taylorii]
MDIKPHKQRTKGVLCVLMGLPAAGKSTASSALASTAQEGVDIECVRFDDDLEEAMIVDTFDVGAWRASRRASLARVRAALERPSEAAALRVVVADDNAQYRSMRHVLFRAACDAAYAFATVFVDVDIEEAVRRNAKRDEGRVPEPTIRRMAAQLELPDGAKHAWERHSVTLGTDGDVDVVWPMLRAAFEAGLPPGFLTAEELRAEEARRDEARAVTVKSGAHAVDLALRRLVAGVAKSEPVLALQKPHRAAVSAALAQARKAALKCVDVDGAIATFSEAFRQGLAATQVPADALAALSAETCTGLE